MADELVAALARAQGKFPTIPKSKTGKVKGMTKDGKSYEYEYTYADLSDILNAVRPPLAAEGIALVQPISTRDDGQVFLTTQLLGFGDRIESNYPLNVGSMQPQQVGSLLTYLRRYCLTSLLGISAQDDDDGQAAQTYEKPRAEPEEPAAEDEARQQAVALLKTLDAAAQETVKVWLRNNKVPALTRKGVTLTQLNALFDFIDSLASEPFEVTPPTLTEAYDGVIDAAIREAKPPFEPVVANPASNIRANLPGSLRKAGDSAMKADT